MALVFTSAGGSGSGGGVASVTAADTSVVVGGTAADPTVRTGTLDVIATDHPPAAAVALNAQKITGLANGTLASDAAAFGQIPAALPPNGSAGGDLSGTYPNPKVAKITETSGPTDLTIGTLVDGQFLKRTGATLVSGAPVASVAATDTSVVVVGTATAPTIATGTLDAVAAAHPAAADWSNNSHKITSLANGSSAQDAAAFGQLPTVLADGAAVGLGYKNWNGAVFHLDASGTSFSSGIVYVSYLWLPIGTLVTNVVLMTAVAGAGTAPTGFFVGLAGPTGTMVAQSNDLHASAGLTTTGPQQFALSATYTTTTGDSSTGLYYVVVLLNGTFGTTQPTFGRGATSSVVFGKALGANPISVGAGGTTGRTALPANGAGIVGGIVSTNAVGWWVACS